MILVCFIKHYKSANTVPWKCMLLAPCGLILPPPPPIIIIIIIIIIIS